MSSKGAGKDQRAVREAARRLLVAVDRTVAAADAIRRARLDLERVIDQEVVEAPSSPRRQAPASAGGGR